MKNVLYLSSMNIFKNNYGGAQCAARNYSVLKKFFQIDYLVTEEQQDKKFFKKLENGIFYLKKNLFLNIGRLFLGYTNNLSFENEKEILKLIKKNNYDIVYIEGSTWGKIYLKIKKINKKIKIITFFHNIEYDFVNSLCNLEKNYLRLFLYKIKLKNVIYNEKLAVKYSDYCITLNPRDTKRLYEVYGGKSNLELPITFEDKYSKNINNLLKEKDYILFVGSLFFANYHGIKWFVENVMPHINKKLLIVGKDFETKKSELERKNVEVIGSVDDLTPYYLNASCMIMPIFEGAGMKVKTAEALMYGKTIYGTTEAFEGYEVEYNKVGGLCNTLEEFIEKINNDKNEVFNEYSRKIFLEKYSFESSVNRMKEFLEKENLI